AASLQAEVSGAGGTGTGHDFVFIPARRSFAAGFSERGERLPQCGVELRESGGFVFDGRGAIEPGRGQRGCAMKKRRSCCAVPKGTLLTMGLPPDLRGALMNAVASRLGLGSGPARLGGVALCLVLAAALAGCNEGKADPKAEAPPPANVQADLDANNFKVDHPELFPLAAAALNVTGVVQPDIARAVPVISLAAGRVVEIKARLGDIVTKGQLLLRVQ